MSESHSQCITPSDSPSLCLTPDSLERTKPSFASISSTKSLLSSCRICLSSLFDPASLICGHKFCENCLNQYWQSWDKSDAISCPLCRRFSLTVDFAEKATVRSTRDFRKKFNAACTGFNNSVDVISDTSLLCLKISILTPVFYFLAKLLGPPLTDLISFCSETLVALINWI